LFGLTTHTNKDVHNYVIKFQPIPFSSFEIQTFTRNGYKDKEMYRERGIAGYGVAKYNANNDK
jgi:hypothetical protein